MSHQVKVHVHGMHCAACAQNISHTLKNQPGVIECHVNFATDTAKLEIEDSAVSLPELSKSIEPLGYSLSSTDHSHHSPKDHEHSDEHSHMQHGNEDLHKMQRNIMWSLPIVVAIFISMIWELVAASSPAFPMFPIGMEIWRPMQFIAASLIQFVLGSGFNREVWLFIKTRKANMYTLVGIGTLIAYIFSTIIVLFPVLAANLNLGDYTYFDVSIVVVGFVYLGKYLETRAKRATSSAVQQLIGLQVKEVTVLRDGQQALVALEEVTLTDTVLVKPGEHIPVDGKVIAGDTHVDESSLTGESLPVHKEVNAEVFTGTLNQEGSIQIKPLKIGENTLLAQIINLVEDAQGSKAPIERLADQISAVFVPVILIIAVLTFIGWLLIGSTFLPFADAARLGLLCSIAVLVVACPCALGLATPTAVIVGLGKAARKGILIKDATTLETLRNIDTIVFDKTGTLTVGKPQLITTTALAETDLSSDEALQIAASLEENSTHPLARAFLQAADEQKLALAEVTSFANQPGLGITATIEGTKYWLGSDKLIVENNLQAPQLTDDFAQPGIATVYLLDEHKVLAAFAVADQLKVEAKQSVQLLQKMDISIILLSGDKQSVADFVGNNAGIDQIVAEVLPPQKADFIANLQKQGHKVAMVGDGINDSPALAQADVGIAMSTGSDIAISAAGVTILQGDLAKLVTALTLSRLTMRFIKQNLFWAFAYNLTGVPIAAGLLYPFGILLNPAIAGMAMAFSSVSVIANSLRLRFKQV